MNNLIKQPRWKTVEYTRSQIVNAGKIIRKNDQSTDEYRHAIDIVDNWRAAHAFPLHVIYVHLRRMCHNKDNVIVAERLKRLDSIIKKISKRTKHEFENHKIMSDYCSP